MGSFTEQALYSLRSTYIPVVYASFMTLRDARDPGTKVAHALSLKARGRSDIEGIPRVPGNAIARRKCY